MTIKSFIDQNYRHFNALALRNGAYAYTKHISSGGKMLITLGGAMSTAEIGISLAEMIRADKVHAICCTGANLEEDLFHLVAASRYHVMPHYRNLTPDDDKQLHDSHLNRVTDTCIPEEDAMRHIEDRLLSLWKNTDQPKFPHEYIYELLRSNSLTYDKDPTTSWLLAACEKDLPIFVPGWEDSTLGNMFAAHYINADLHHSIIRPGIEYMTRIIDWYTYTSQQSSMGIFQIGGGIAGDFPICVVPLINQDIARQNPSISVPLWSYFCQISDSTPSYGSYSGAPPSEKISWGKLSPTSSMHIIESDATIVAPLIFAYVLNQ